MFKNEKDSQSINGKVNDDNLGQNIVRDLSDGDVKHKSMDVNNPDVTLFKSSDIDSKINIKPEYSKLFDRLSDQEYNNLKSSILSKGCVEPILVDDDFTLIDGHHRLEICRELHKPYQLKRMHFSNEDEKILFILKLHFGRRGFNAIQESDVRGRHYNLRKLAVNQKGNQYTSKPSATSTQGRIDTALEIAKLFNVSRRTIIRDGKTNRSLNLLKEQISNLMYEEKAMLIREKITKQVIPISKNNLERISNKLPEVISKISSYIVDEHNSGKNDKVIGRAVNKLIRTLCKKIKGTSKQENPDENISRTALNNAVENLNLNKILADCKIGNSGYYCFENEKIKINFFVK